MSDDFDECLINSQWVTPKKKQAVFYINEIYTQGFLDGFNECRKEMLNNG